MLDAVLFDFNGVLVDDEALHLDGFNEVLAPLGLAIDPGEYASRYLGFDDRGAFEAVLDDRGRQLDVAREPDLVARLIQAKSLVYARLAKTRLRVFDGAAALVAGVADVCPVGVVSGALRGEIEAALAIMGVRDRVGAIVAAEDVTRCKPDPAGYLAALRALRRTLPWLDPARVVAVEDSTAGIVSARAAGLRVLAVAHSYDAATLRAAGAEDVYAHIAAVGLRELEAVAARPAGAAPGLGTSVRR